MYLSAGRVSYYTTQIAINYSWYVNECVSSGGALQKMSLQSCSCQSQHLEDAVCLVIRMTRTAIDKKLYDRQQCGEDLALRTQTWSHVIRCSAYIGRDM